MRQNLVRKLRNNNRRRLNHDVVKDYYALITAGEAKKASAQLPLVYKALDLSAKYNVIPKNRASRMKSKAQNALTNLAK